MNEVIELLRYKKAELEHMHSLEVVFDSEYNEGDWKFKVAVLKLEIKDLQDEL